MTNICVLMKNRNLNTFKLLWWGFYPGFPFISIEKPLFKSIFRLKSYFWNENDEVRRNTNGIQTLIMLNTHTIWITYEAIRNKRFDFVITFSYKTFFYETPISYNARLNVLNMRYGIYLTYEHLNNTPDWTLNELSSANTDKRSKSVMKGVVF